jgi:hypothetical protein
MGRQGRSGCDDSSPVAREDEDEAEFGKEM